MKLVGVGDSWAFGAELYDPEILKGLSRLPEHKHNLHFDEYHKSYREKHRYLGVLANKLNIDEIVDITSCACANNAVVRSLITWLNCEGYTTGQKDTRDLFVSIGWTSPERVDFYYNHKWAGDNYIPMGPHVEDKIYDKFPDVREFNRLYYMQFNDLAGVFHRWINQINYLELILKKYKIKYVMHQAFYHYYKHFQIGNIDDKQVRGQAFDKLTLGDMIMWNNVDEKRFINKNHPDLGTAHHYILSVLKDPKVAFYDWHPTELGHKVWAEYMYDYIIQNNLLEDYND